MLVGVTGCYVCEQNSLADRGADEWAIARLETGYVRLNPTQYYRGATFFAASACVAEVHALPANQRSTHLVEMSAVAEAISQAFDPIKMNYEALGNTCPHLHWWLTPRHADDPRPRAPIWENLDFLRAHWTRSARPDAVERDRLRHLVLAALPAELVAEALC